MKNITLSSAGMLGVLALAAGESATISMPNATGWINLGVYEKTGTNRTAVVDGEEVTAEVELVGGGFKDVGSTQLTHLLMQGTTATVIARHDIGEVHVKYDGYQGDPRIAAKMAEHQAKAAA